MKKNWSSPQKLKKQKIYNKGAKFILESKFKIERDVKKHCDNLQKLLVSERDEALLKHHIVKGDK